MQKWQKTETKTKYFKTQNYKLNSTDRIQTELLCGEAKALHIQLKCIYGKLQIIK